MGRCRLGVFSSLVRGTIRSIFLFCVITVSFVHAQIEQLQKQLSGTDTPRHAVSGTVINSVTGMPIARALVGLSSEILRHTMTDANGAFRFESVPEGLAKLEAERPGFLKSTEVSPELRTSTVSVQVTSDVDGVALKLVPQGEISGYVRSIKGEPIEDFPVRLYRRKIVDGWVQWENLSSLITNDDGYFRVFGMRAESVVVSAGPERWRARTPGAKHLGYPSVFYPNAPGLATAGVISVSPGQQVQADFSLSQGPLFEISGEIAGVPVTVDTKVELSSSSGEGLPLIQPHPERHDFSAYVTEGRYTLRASAEVEGQLWRATVPLSISSNMAGIHVTLGERPPIPVKVRNESDAGQNRKTNPSSASVTLTSRTSSLNPLEVVARQSARDQSAMEIAGVEPGSYLVEVNSYDSYVKSATSGSTDLLNDDLLVPGDGRVAPVDIVLSNDGGEVGGSVKLPDHDSSASVLLVPETRSSKEIKTVVTQATGQFQFEQVRPGNYILFAFDRVEDLEYRNPDVLSSYLSKGTHVTVAPRQLVTASLNLILVGK